MMVIPAPAPRRKNPISLTPLIDVVFILLIFFMLTSAYIDYRAIELPVLAAQGDRSDRHQQLLTVTVSSTDVWVSGDGFDPDQALTLDVLSQRLKAHVSTLPAPQRHDLTVIVAPLAQTPLQHTVSVLDRLSSAGVTSIRFESTHP